MSTDLQDLMGDPGSSSNCCGARINMQGLCSECGEHCTDESEEGPSDAKQEQIAESRRYFAQKESLREEEGI